VSATVLLGRRAESASVVGAERCPAAAVLGPVRAATPLAAALALRLAARGGVGCALLAGPARVPGPRLPSASGATRAARALVARGIPATASGRLVRAELPDIADFGRAAAVVEGPAVLVVSAPRTLALDAILRTLDALVLCGEEDLYTELGQASLSALGPPVTRVAPVRAPLAAGLALAGAGAPAPLGEAVAAVLPGVPA
jgi:hypothetical protein